MKTELIKKRCEALINAGEIDYSYSSKMKGELRLRVMRHAKIIFEFEQDDRLFYKGRGSRYNTSINHDFIIININLTKLKTMYSILLKTNRERLIKARRKEEERNVSIEKFGCVIHGSDDWITVEEIQDTDKMLKHFSRLLSINRVNLKKSFEESKGYEGKCNIKITDVVDIYHACFCCNDKVFHFVKNSISNSKEYFS